MKKLMEQMAEELSAAFEKSGYDPSYGKETEICAIVVDLEVGSMLNAPR